MNLPPQIRQAAAWLMIITVLVVCGEVFQRTFASIPVAWIFGAQDMLYSSLFMLAGAYCWRERACAWRLLFIDEAAHAGFARSCSISCSSLRASCQSAAA